MIRLVGSSSSRGLLLRRHQNSWNATAALVYNVSFSSKMTANFSSASSSSTAKGIPYSKLTVGIPKETFPLEKRVAATPESVKRLVAPGFSVLVEDGAGETAFYSNADYEAAGAKIVPSTNEEVWKQSDIILKLRPPSAEQIELLDGQKTLFSFLYPRQNEELLQKLQDKGTTAFAMDMIPRTLSRGQTYDALSVSE
jgi:NAD(P) transhydrogenase